MLASGLLRPASSESLHALKGMDKKHINWDLNPNIVAFLHLAVRPVTGTFFGLGTRSAVGMDIYPIGIVFNYDVAI